MLLRTVFAPVLLLATIGSASAVELTVVNNSQYAVHKLYVALSKSKKWGTDQLGNASIMSKEKFTLRNIPEGTYDLKIVDEDDDSCVVSGINFDRDKEWTLTDAIMENCEGDD